MAFILYRLSHNDNGYKFKLNPFYCKLPKSISLLAIGLQENMWPLFNILYCFKLAKNFAHEFANICVADENSLVLLQIKCNVFIVKNNPVKKGKWGESKVLKCQIPNQKVVVIPSFEWRGLLKLSQISPWSDLSAMWVSLFFQLNYVL